MSREHPEVVARYRAVLEPRLAALVEAAGHRSPVEIDPEALEALRALGYVR